MQERIQEIRTFLEHGDNSLAIRRLLDLSFDTGDNDLLRESVLWSRRFRTEITENDGVVTGLMSAETDSLLEELGNRAEDTQFARRPLLHANNIAKKYPHGNFELRPIEIKLHSGELVGVVGENGNGKTTLLRCVARQLDIDSGSIHYHTIQNPDDYAIRHHLAFIPQRIPRWYGSLKDNLHFSASISGIYGKHNELMVDFMLERMDLSGFAHLNWNQISSGYRTRFEIARVLLQRPRLMLLDEPLANLDILAQQTILNDLRYMAKSVKHPMGVILSSQQLHEVEKVADEVLFLRRGECLHRTAERTGNEKTVVEIETPADREEVAALFAREEVEIHFNGGYYTISSPSMNGKDILVRLTSQEIRITYFRDITHSTKRFF